MAEWDAEELRDVLIRWCERCIEIEDDRLKYGDEPLTTRQAIEILEARIRRPIHQIVERKARP